ncbi:MAG: hypothetical protein A3F82_00550 [Deltaproteobacteria bacterium RIFCSPLOWO2_12_FULL_44_12]|nr:MAG: hypothetical protein A2712_04405 [Deltaproteobacteria bacterium RIFCSPHIGHO2_01_FULL_43_49]OGQ16426.1 MAG: hypothetical protein A3D22_02370 [Deltaproteobacteria bacterium RIFCSPHIGHO2_02_FULL_44_53]OGQ27747.1 MAG: hypothetical protein A3D98_08615 [Deltaproteobacteria bacterium RIFCSPHIGHO2_12_FULL_44_21]OGQ32944.1 MAG: hypothetical protein A2979_10300 [Deltaproteobacteria bacterium RIFCSPLOWO2_01_FULL_45_74]OGQ42046.1 MAG: hypothetical protein A3I70_10090 [Deltaproteobacteria bacterium 
MPPKTPSFHRVGEILENVFKGKNWGSKIKQYSIFSQWEEIVGAKIAKHASPKLWRGCTLFVDVENSAWLQELKMMEPEILEHFRKTCPDLKIDKIRLQLANKV